MSPLLKGKALELYSRLSVKEAQDYQELTGALLKRLNLTKGFKQTLEMDRPNTLLDYSYLTRWTDQVGEMSAIITETEDKPENE